jgi:hypothetical protein
MVKQQIKQKTNGNETVTYIITHVLFVIFIFMFCYFAANALYIICLFALLGWMS